MNRFMRRYLNPNAGEGGGGETPEAKATREAAERDANDPVKLKAQLEELKKQNENLARFQTDMHKFKGEKEALEKKIKEQEEASLLATKNWEALAPNGNGKKPE